MKNGVEDTESADSKAWAGALENYTIREVDGLSMLTIETDVTDEYKSHLEESWPRVTCGN